MTRQRHPDKTARPFLQTGALPAAPPGSGWNREAEEAQLLPDHWVAPLWYLPRGIVAHPTKAVGPPQPLEPLLRSLQAERAAFGGERTDARARTSPMAQGLRFEV